MSSVAWVKNSFYVILFILLAIATVNFLINENHYFEHNFLKIKKHQPDERKYKTNYIEYSKKINKYDSLLLGSSVSTYISQKDFININMFNYAVSGMIPKEYFPTIEYFEKNNKGLKKIYIGLEFFSTNLNEVNRIAKFNISKYINKKNKMSYLLTFLFKIPNIKIYSDSMTYYHRWENVHYAKKIKI